MDSSLQRALSGRLPAPAHMAFYGALIAVSFLSDPLANKYSHEFFLPAKIASYILSLAAACAYCGIFIHENSALFSGLRKIVSAINLIVVSLAVAITMAFTIPGHWAEDNVSAMGVLLVIGLIVYYASKAIRVSHKVGNVVMYICLSVAILAGASQLSIKFSIALSTLLHVPGIIPIGLAAGISLPLYGLSRIVFRLRRHGPGGYLKKIVRQKAFIAPAIVLFAIATGLHAQLFSIFFFLVTLVLPFVIDGVRNGRPAGAMAASIDRTHSRGEDVSLRKTA